MTRPERALPLAAVLLVVLWPLVAFFCEPLSFDDLGNDLIAAPYMATVRLGLLTAAGTLLLGLPAAWALAGSGRGAHWLRAGAFAVLLVPPYLAASAWLGIAWRLGLLSLDDQVLALLPGAGFLGGGNLLVAAWVLSCALWPCVALPAAAALAAVGREGREAARLARGPAGCFWGVELPAALPAAVIGAILAFALACAELGTTDLFMVTTASRDVLRGFEVARDYSVAAGRSLPLLGLGLLLGLGMVIVGWRTRFVELARARFSPAPAPRWAGRYAAGLMALTLGAVLFGLLLNAGGAGALARALGEEFGLVLRSLFVALGAAALAVVLGATLLWALPSRGKCAGPALALSLGLLSLTLLLPGSLWGMGVLATRRALTMDPPIEAGLRLLDSPLVLFWAGAARAALGATAVLAWGRGGLNRELIESARLAGLSAPRRLWLLAGLMRRHLLAALLLGAALAFGEIGAAIHVSPPGWELLSLRVFNAMHNGHAHVTAALALVTTALAALFAALAAAVVPRRSTGC